MHGATICGLRKVNISRGIGKLRVPLSWWRLVCCFSLRSLRPWLQKTVPNSKVHTPNPKGAESETSGESLFWFGLQNWKLGLYQTGGCPLFLFVSFIVFCPNTPPTPCSRGGCEQHLHCGALPFAPGPWEES